LTGRRMDQRGDSRGNLGGGARRAGTPDWRIEPNLSGQVSLADASLSVLGVPINVGNEVKPFLDRALNEQLNALQARLRSDPVFEQTARRDWDKLRPSIPLHVPEPRLPPPCLTFP